MKPKELSKEEKILTSEELEDQYSVCGSPGISSMGSQFTSMGKGYNSTSSLPSTEDQLKDVKSKLRSQ